MVKVYVVLHRTIQDSLHSVTADADILAVCATSDQAYEVQDEKMAEEIFEAIGDMKEKILKYFVPIVPDDQIPEYIDHKNYKKYYVTRPEYAMIDDIHEELMKPEFVGCQTSTITVHPRRVDETEQVAPLFPPISNVSLGDPAFVQMK